MDAATATYEQGKEARSSSSPPQPLQQPAARIFGLESFKDLTLDWRPSVELEEPHLPPEVLYRILELGAASFERGEWSQRSKYLRRAALVSSVCKEQAQRLLWEDATITSDRAVQSFIEGAQKGRSTIHLAVGTEGDPRPTLSDAEVRRALQVCIGLRTLELANVYRLHAHTLSLSALKGLKSLSLKRSIRLSPFISGSWYPRLEFSLDDLDLELSWTPEQSSPILVAALLSKVVGQATIDLKPPRAQGFNGDRPPLFRASIPYPPLPSPLKSLRLRTLDLDGGRQALIGCLLPFLRQLHSLEHLSLDLLDLRAVAAIPHPLETLAVQELPFAMYDDSLISLLFEGAYHTQVRPYACSHCGKTFARQ
ncbi:hypothetical protein BCR35DRAFT_329371 [Leucosporidium creatinivorum]|uniref:F-box domain-containing protein n=1 Tax=Leucosporidium creatinivorum TaxID=106004 RepID=A0A1Y2FZE3_9BASI|nr:hypothetical protein BCR35DRAFT_329371 [Leucosporidium creatinivorum]